MNEYVQDFSARFMRTCESIPTDVKPPPGAAKLHYADAFDSEFTLLLRERRYTLLQKYYARCNRGRSQFIGF